MTGNTDPELLAEAASRFLHLREEGDDAARRALRRWMALDLRHAAAIDLVERGWSNAGVLSTTTPPEWIASPRPAARRDWMRARRTSPQQWGWAAGLAAAILLLVGAELRGIGLGWPQDYATQATAQDIALRDGSSVRLQPHSRAVVRLSLLSRDITLNAGGGAFIVAHETTRPFVVSAGTIAVEATGTRFSVTTTVKGVRVALWHGGVRLRDRTTDVVLAYMKPGDRAEIRNGGRMVLTHSPSVPVPPQVFVFDDTPLADAVARIATGGNLRVRFARPGLAHLPVSSVYHGQDLSAFLDDLGAVEPICWRQRGNTIEISDAPTACGTKGTVP